MSRRRFNLFSTFCGTLWDITAALDKRKRNQANRGESFTSQKPTDDFGPDP